MFTSKGEQLTLSRFHRCRWFDYLSDDEILDPYQQQVHNPMLVAAGFSNTGVAVPWLDDNRLRLVFGENSIVLGPFPSVGIQTRCLDIGGKFFQLFGVLHLVVGEKLVVAGAENPGKRRAVFALRCFSERVQRVSNRDKRLSRL